MADINPTVQVKNNDANKIRNTMDFSASSDLSGSQFLDLISSTVSTSSSDEDDIDAKETYTVSTKSKVNYTYDTSAKVDAAPISDAKQASLDKADIKEKIKAKLKEISEQNDVPVKDTKALKALQKVANFLLKANKDGDIALPKAMVDKLQAFVDKGDDLKAADVTQFMSDFNDAFKQMVVTMPAQGTSASTASDGKDLKWPSDVLDALKDLGLQTSSGGVDKPLTVIDVLRTVKSLVNQSEKDAIKTLDEKSKEAALPQDQASILLVGNNANAAVSAKTETKAAASDDTAAQIQTAQVAAPIAPAADDASIKKVIKDLQKDMEQAAQINQTAPAKDAKPTAADTGKIITDATAIAKAFNAAKSQPTVASLNLSNDASPASAAKVSDKAIAPSLSKISIEAQAPGNNDKQFNNPHDNNNGQSSAAASQAKANLAASVAVSSNVDVKIAEPEPAIRSVDASNITPAGLNAVTEGAKTASNIAKAATVASTLPSAATQQVMAQIVAKGDKTTQISVNLTPAELGQVEVRLNIQKDGSVHTVITVDKPETLALLQKDSAQLERSLQQAGLNADAKNMSFNLRDGNQAQQFNQGRKRFSRSDIGSTVTEVAITVAPEGQIITDNRVNYHA
jgi:chemotaxis protein MotD